MHIKVLNLYQKLLKYKNAIMRLFASFKIPEAILEEARRTKLLVIELLRLAYVRALDFRKYHEAPQNTATMSKWASNDYCPQAFFAPPFFLLSC